MSKARLQVSRKIDMTPTTLYNWERKLTGRSTISLKGTLSPNNNVTRPHITSVNLHVPGKGDVTLDNQLLTQISELASYTG